MGKKVRIQLAPEDRDRLEALIANGNTPQKHVRRAQIVLLAGDGDGNHRDSAAVAREQADRSALANALC